MRQHPDEPFLREWLRGELGPEAFLADRLVYLNQALKLVPDLIHRLDEYYPPKGAAPPPPPLRDVTVIEHGRWGAIALAALIAGSVGAGAAALLLS